MRNDIPKDMFVHLLSELKTGEYIVGRKETHISLDVRHYKYSALSLRDGIELLNIQKTRTWDADAGHSETFNESYEFTCEVLGYPVCGDSYEIRTTVHNVDDMAPAFLQPNFAFMYAELKKRENYDFKYRLAESLLKMRRVQMARARAAIDDDFSR